MCIVRSRRVPLQLLLGSRTPRGRLVNVEPVFCELDAIAVKMKIERHPGHDMQPARVTIRVIGSLLRFTQRVDKRLACRTNPQRWILEIPIS